MTDFASFKTPFAASSLWYAKPVNPVLSAPVIKALFNPTTGNEVFPDIGPGGWSSGIYEALPTDKPMTVYKIAGSAGIHDKDAEAYLPSVTIDRWPAGAVGAAGSDGHCDIIDVAAKEVISFWVLKLNAAGQFTAAQISRAPLDGSGFGEGGRYNIGARAAGIPTCAGMVRQHEMSDGEPVFPHALVCSLDYSALSRDPGYVLPATMSDQSLAGNTGTVPEGALLMLPADYDTSRFDRWPAVKKAIETMKVYGVRVGDRNTNTPIKVYAEFGCAFGLHVGGWDAAQASALGHMRKEIRMVMSVDRFITAEGKTWAAPARMNLLSLRGPWKLKSTGLVTTLFSSRTQRLELPAEAGGWKNADGKGFQVKEYKPQEGKYYKIYAESDCGATFKMTINGFVNDAWQIRDTGSIPTFGSRFIKWPAGGWTWIEAAKPAGKAGYLSVRFIEVTQAEYAAGANKIAFA